MEKDENFLIFDLSEPYEELNFFRRGSNWYFAEHHHAYFQIIYVIDGILLLQINGEEYSLKRGHICIIPPFQPHSLRTETGYYQLGINLQSNKDNRGIIGLLDNYLKDFIMIDYNRLLEDLPAFEKEFQELTKLSKIKIVHLLDGLIVSCVENVVNGTDIDFKNKLITFLNKNLSHKITLSDVSKELSISQSHLERLVRMEFGSGVIELYNKLRINKACSLLSNSNYNIENISEYLGFYDTSHFSHFFKQKIKMSPTQYRKHKNWAK